MIKKTLKIAILNRVDIAESICQNHSGINRIGIAESTSTPASHHQ